MDDRIRQRRTEVRRAGLRRRRRVLLAVLLVLALAAGAVAVTRSPLFAITAVRVDGVTPKQARRIMEVAQVQRGQNLLSADFDDAVARTTALPWIATATVQREPPSTVVIQAVPRRPVAILRTPQGEWVVDAEGVVIAEARRRRLPVIDIATDAVAVPGVAIDDPTAHNALELYHALPVDVRGATRAVEAAGHRTVRVQLALADLDEPSGYRRGRQTWVRMGTAGDVDDQVAVLRALLTQLRRARTPLPTEIDIRVPANPVIIP